MDKKKTSLYVLLGVIFMDLLVLFGMDLPALGQESGVVRVLNQLIGPDRLIGTVHPDVFLSPLILLLIAAHGYFLTPQNLKSRNMILIALVLAAVAEFIQKGIQYNFISTSASSGVLTSFMAIAAAAYYALYSWAFVIAGGRPGIRSLIPVIVVLVYAILIVIAIRMPSEMIWQAILYLPVACALTACAFQGILHDDLSRSSLLRASGVVLLIVSDSVRTVSVFKFENGYFVWSELLIMVLFFMGHLCVVKSIEVESS